MAFVCPDEKTKKRQDLLKELKRLVDQMDDGDQCFKECMRKSSVNNGSRPVVDPLPKLCLPVCSPCVPHCPVGAPLPDCCPQSDRSAARDCCQTKCTLETFEPLTTAQPVSVPRVLPVCTIIPPSCVPVYSPTARDQQPSVPCNPPSMMVCYKKPKNNGNECSRSKSRELRASILHVGCECEKHNGLQDNCPRSECHGSPECLTKPDPTCGPSAFAGMKHLGKPYCRDDKNNQYECYPVCIGLAPCPPWGQLNGRNGMTNARKGNGNKDNSCCQPGMPLITQVPCPPPNGKVSSVCPTGPCPMIYLPAMSYCPPNSNISSHPPSPMCYPPPCCICPS